MRILYSHRVQSRDGQSVHIDSLVAALRAAGHEVEVHGPGAYERAGFGGESRLVGLVRRLLPGAAAELAEVAYGLVAYARLAAAARRFKPDLVYERYGLFHLPGTLLARLNRLPLFLEVNSPLAQERAAFGGLRLPRLARWLEGVTWRSASRVLVVTAVLRDLGAAQGGVPVARIAVLHNGIHPADYPERPARHDGPPVLGFIGFVRDWHGMDTVLDAMAGPLLAGLSLTLVGEGPARPGLERQAAGLGLGERVRFAGLAPREAVPGVLAGFDIALQPRSVPYASPLKLFEYMAAGLAIVAPAQANIMEVLEHERTALLFDPDVPGAMCDAVARLAADPVLRARLGEAARRQITQGGYTWAENARRVEALFRAAAPGAAAADWSPAVAR